MHSIRLSTLLYDLVVFKNRDGDVRSEDINGSS